ncbi:hypothetical protein Drose_06030 [Dactylosporangium roseum]|uniref:Uncharacterized protein n=1 Tax=Dactylosporangium roseum TaxID=47989 RepID=A0ABY5ZA16_9ACTN|nr:hypothetical protein [Dactylosporangium roseum]UWZ37830.1 hypothetical protein Drose_06030 [Dactylosporangium roseum]
MSAWQRRSPEVAVAGQVGGDWQIGVAYDAKWARLLPGGLWAIVIRTCFRQENDGGELLTTDTDYSVRDHADASGDAEIASNGRVFGTDRPGRFTDADVQAEARYARAPTDAEWNAAMPDWTVAR